MMHSQTRRVYPRTWVAVHSPYFNLQRLFRRRDIASGVLYITALVPSSRDSLLASRCGNANKTLPNAPRPSTSSRRPPIFTCWRLTTGAYCRNLNVVVTHTHGFFVGGSRGEIMVFEHDKKTAGGGRDVYTLTRVVRIFGVELVELRPTIGPEYRWVRWGD